MFEMHLAFIVCQLQMTRTDYGSRVRVLKPFMAASEFNPLRTDKMGLYTKLFEASPAEAAHNSSLHYSVLCGESNENENMIPSISLLSMCTAIYIVYLIRCHTRKPSTLFPRANQFDGLADNALRQCSIPSHDILGLLASRSWGILIVHN